MKDLIDLSKIIDSADEGKIDIAIIDRIFSYPKPLLNTMNARLWRIASQLETGKVLITSDKKNARDNVVAKTFSGDLVRHYFSSLAKFKIPPNFKCKPNEFRASGHTLFFSSKLGARHVLELSNAMANASPRDLNMSSRVAISNLHTDGDELLHYLSSLLKVGLNPTLNNHSFINNLDVALGGQDLLFLEDISESKVLEKVSSANYPLFEELSKFPQVEYTTPLTMKYHLIVTDSAPMLRLGSSSDKEKEVLLTLMRS